MPNPLFASPDPPRDGKMDGVRVLKLDVCVPAGHTFAVA